MGKGKTSWGSEFVPKAFAGTRERPGLSSDQNDNIVALLHGGQEEPADDAPSRPTRIVSPPTRPGVTPSPSVSPTPAVEPLRRQLASAQQEAEEARQQADDARRQLSIAKQETEAARRQADTVTARADKASEHLQEVERRAAQDRDARLRAEQQIQQAREEARRTAQAPRRQPSPARGPVHEKLIPKLMRFPPTLLDRLTALSKAYGLDQTSTVRMALSEMYERAVKAGTIEVV